MKVGYKWHKLRLLLLISKVRKIKIQPNLNWKFVRIYADEGISGTPVKNKTEFM